MAFDDCIIEINDPLDMEFVYSTDQQSQTPLPKKKKKPSVSSCWAYSAINNLIMTVEEQPCVWEYSCSDYKDRYKREQAWREIEEKCSGHTVEDCKAKWANLKTAFQNVKKKIKAKSGQGAENFQPHWLHWTAMQFYNRHSAAKTSSTVSSFNIPEADLGSSASQNCVTLEAASSLTEPHVNEKSDILQRAIKCLDAEEDNWHSIGMF